MKWLKRLGVMAVLIVIAAVGVFSVQSYRDKRHQQEADRIWQWFNQAHAHPPAGVNREMWEFICGSGLRNSVGNCLTRRRYVATEKLKKLADYLDATQGKDLQSLGGLYGMMDYIEALGTHCAGYFDGVRSQVTLEHGLQPTPIPIRIP